jgi:sortase A
MTTRDTVLLNIQRLLLSLGAILLTFFVTAMIHREVYSRLALYHFDHDRPVVTRQKSQASLVSVPDQRTDFSLFSQQRARAYRQALLIVPDWPLAVLQIDRLHMRVPVFDGTDDLVLNRGLGWIAGTTRPGERGNIGIAGHRDGFFRPLKDIATGDIIRLSTARNTAIYIAEQIEIVNPDNVDVLRPRRMPSITLTTCYPFYYFGDAPQRFIVHAALKQQADTAQPDQSFASARTNQPNDKEK